MKRLCIQFHATAKELVDFVKKVLTDNRYNICGIQYFPFVIDTLSGELNESELKRYEHIVIAKGDIPTAETNGTFMRLQSNNLIIDIGADENDAVLKESAFTVFSEEGIDADWKKAIADFKKQLHKGAWAVNPSANTKDFYKNHLYTEGAKQAYERGVRIVPVGGWVYYELKQE